MKYADKIHLNFSKKLTIFLSLSPDVRSVDWLWGVALSHQTTDREACKRRLWLVFVFCSASSLLLSGLCLLSDSDETKHFTHVAVTVHLSGVIMEWLSSISMIVRGNFAFVTAGNFNSFQFVLWNVLNGGCWISSFSTNESLTKCK